MNYDIPLKLSHTVVDIKGKEELKESHWQKWTVKESRFRETEEEYTCDTLLLSCGLNSGKMRYPRYGAIDMNRVTSGPKVNESLETNIEGVFACGNVLHVHDLVDFVSEEAKTAGRNAAEYVKNLQADTDDRDKHSREEAAEIVLNPVEGVRYTVPSTINPVHMDENLTVRFRVGGVYKNCYVSVYFNEERVIHKKRPVVAPGEMEQIKLTKEQLMKYPGLKTITVKIEEA